MAPVIEAWGDVFTFPTALAHAVSADLHMGAGVAVDFKLHFGRVEELRSQGKGVGEVAYLQHNGHYIFYLITKQCYWEKVISLNNILSCLFQLRDLCISLGVQEVTMPRIGCGLDLLKFQDVLPRIIAAFQGVPVKVNVVTPPPLVRGMAVAGDSQALRLLVARGKLPSGYNQFSRKVGLCGSGWTVSNLLDALNELQDNALGNVLVLIGTNDVSPKGLTGPKYKAAKSKLRNSCAILRTTLAAKCKACCRAVVTTIPPFPRLMAPTSGETAETGRARGLWNEFNQRLQTLSGPRFHVLDLFDHFTQNGSVREDLFERFMGFSNRREDRMHINSKGMKVLLEAVDSIPPVNLL